MGRSISPMEEPVAGSDPSAAPRLIVPMSLQLVIPRRVALQQSSPPLHQPSVILKEKRKFEKEEPLNCMCANSKLSQQRGSPQQSVPELCLQVLLGNFRIEGTERKIHAKRKHDANRTTRRTRCLGVQVARTWT